MVRRKWWVVAALAIVGAAAGFLISQRANQSIKPLFQATTYVEFESELGDRSRDSTIEKVKAAAEEARVYNAAALEQRLGQIAIDEPRFQVLFIARNQDRTEAAVVSEQLRAAYVNGTAQARAEERQARLDEIIVEAAEVLAQIEALTPPEVETEPPPEISPALQARIDSLQTLHDALEQQLTQLNVNLVLAQSGDERVDDPEDIQEQIDSIEFRMAAIRSELVVIALENDLNPSDITPQTTQQQDQQQQSPAPPTNQDPRDVTPDPEDVPEGGLTDQLTIDALEDRYSDLTSEFGDLFLEAEAETLPVLAPVEVEDLTPAPVSAVLNAALGLIAGAILGVGLLFLSKSARGNIYGPADVSPLPLLAELPSAGAISGKPDRERTQRLTAERAEGIRQMRHAILRYVDSSPTTLALGLSGVGVDDSEVSILAVDIGNRVAASDRFVLVVDLNFETTVMYEGHSGVTVAKLLQVMRTDAAAGSTYFKETLIEGDEGRLLRVVAPGRLADDATDAVLTDGFVQLLTLARDHFDVIIAVLPPAADELTQALRRRIDGVVPVVVERVSRRSELERLTSDVDAGLAPALGVALLTGPPGSKLVARVQDTLRPKPRGTRARSETPPPSKKPAKRAAAATEAPRGPQPPQPRPDNRPAEPAAPKTAPAPTRLTASPQRQTRSPAPAPRPKRAKKKTKPEQPVEVDVAKVTPNEPAPISRTRAVVEWIKAWPYNDMEPLPQLPKERRPETFDDIANPRR